VNADETCHWDPSAADEADEGSDAMLSAKDHLDLLNDAQSMRIDWGFLATDTRSPGSLVTRYDMQARGFAGDGLENGCFFHVVLYASLGKQSLPSYYKRTDSGEKPLGEKFYSLLLEERGDSSRSSASQSDWNVSTLVNV
jgi:hypothetical protein